MKRMNKVGWVLVCCMIMTSAHAAPVVEKPSVMPEAMVSITVPDLHGFIDAVGGIVAKASPMMNGAFIKNMVGMQLGDPGMAGIAPGKGLSIVALDLTNVFAVVEVAEAQVGAYTNAVASQGIQFSYKDGLLVVGKTAEQVAAGCGMTDAVRTQLLSGREPVLRVSMQPAALIERNNEKIQGMLQMIPVLMGSQMMKQPGATLDSTQATLRILEGELRVLLSLASQCDIAEVVLAPENGSVRISETYVPKAGTRLAALCSAAAVHAPHEKIRSGYLGKGTLLFDSTIANPKAMMDFMVAEAEQLSKEMKLVDVDLPALIKKSGKLWAVCGGSMCETVGLSKSGISVGYLMDVKDEAEALAITKAMPVDMEPFLKLYETLGISMSVEFKENVRVYKDVKIHQLRMNMAMENQPPEVAEQMASMNLTNMVYDIAFVDKIMIYAMGAAKVETIIDRLKDETFKPTPIKARQVYPAGGFYYLDLDIGEYLSFVASFMPDEGIQAVEQQMVALFQGTEPVTSAGFKEDGCIMWSVNIPGDLIGKFGQMGMMMQMQKMQQQMGAPQGTPGAAPQPAPAPAP